MAGDGAKRRLEANRRRLGALRAAALATTVLYAAVRLYWRAATRSSWHWAGLAATLLAHGVAYLGVAAAARPTYSSGGALLDGGGDLDRGTASMFHDIIYITCAVQALAAFTNWAWWLYALVPGYGLFMLWTKLIYPHFIKAKPKQEDVIDEKTLARLERADKRAERRRMKRF